MGSWVDKVKTQFKITLGDGTTYTPLSFNANRSTEYNLADFTFRNLDGSLIDKRRPMGTVYNLELYFQGADNIDLATAFKKSADNSNPWVIQHQFYGRLVVQPISPIYHDNANNILNATRIIVTVKETLTKAALVPTESAADVITAAHEVCVGAYASYYVSVIPIPSVKTVNQMTNNISTFKKIMNKAAALEATVNNAVNKAYSAAAGAIGKVQGAIESIQGLFNIVYTLPNSVLNRMNYLVNTAIALTIQDINIPNQIISSIIDTNARIQLYFTEIGSLISALCNNTVTNVEDADYAYSSQVMEVIKQITTTYNAYLATLDTLQSFNNTEPYSFIPDFQTMFALDNLVNYTITNLYNIQAKSKQPRVVTLTFDTNIIQVAKTIYGLLPDDSTIDRVIQDNNIVGPELIQLAKGRQILYYV